MNELTALTKPLATAERLSVTFYNPTTLSAFDFDFALYGVQILPKWKTVLMPI